MNSFDVSIAFDRTTYLDNQIKLFADFIVDKIPSDTVLHITTNRDKTDESIRYICNKVKNYKLYIKEPPNLISRCRYLLNAVEVDSSADYLIRMDLDTIPMKNVSDLMKNIKLNEDLLIQTENRRVIPNDNLESRIWRQIYKAMNMKVPDIKMSYTENKEIGKPLFNTGIFAIRTERLKEVVSNWKRLTSICENWIDYNIHPNEFAFTAMAFNYDWKFVTISDKQVFNPIGHFRKGKFPSTELIDNCKLPEDVVILHWHKPRWLKKIVE